jgi:methionyl-tRNA synthetase
MNKNYYITPTLPYVNAKLHIGHALELIQTDVLARYKRLQGYNVIFNTGSDEHGQKIYQKALEANRSPQEYVDGFAKEFEAVQKELNLSYTDFIRTTDPNHKKAAQKFWEICDENGYIEKRVYQAKYCVGCEMEKTDSELENGLCPLHPNYELEQIDEENYFFLFSKLQDKLLDFYEKNPNFVVPNNRYNEIKAFVGRGLRDFSISRVKEKMPWGIEVPGDSEQVMYVWFDALVNYISTLGWPDNNASHSQAGRPDDNALQNQADVSTNMNKFETFWGTIEQTNAIQVAGKDNLRPQTAMWQGMLLAAGLPNTKQVFIHGFITSEGQKMSKSLGNVVDPYDLIKKYGVDAVRYFLLGGLPAFDDGDFSITRFEEYYTAHLVNGIGNLTSRIITMLEKYSDNTIPAKAEDCFDVSEFWKNYDTSLDGYAFDILISHINKFVSKIDIKISEEKPWEKAKKGEDITELLYQLIEALRHIAIALIPILPDTAEKIFEQLKIESKKREWGECSEGHNIKKGDILFNRL